MLKEELKLKKVKFGTFSRSTQIDNTEIIAEAGYDFIVYDAQHGIFSDNEIRNLINTSLRKNISPIVRISDPLEGKIIHTLDFGAIGIIIPGLETVDEVKKAFSFTKFYPIGSRGLNGASPMANHGDIKVNDYMESENKKVISLLMVESKYMVDHIDELTKIDTIDGFFIGPNDLSVSLGVPGNTTSSVVVDSIKKVCDVALKADKIVGGYAGNIDQAKLYKSLGMTLISHSNDFKYLKKASKESLDLLKEI